MKKSLITHIFIGAFISLQLFLVSSESWAQASWQKPSSQPQGSSRAKVLTTMDSGGYTYVEYKEGETKKWLAGPQTKLSVGDEIEFGQGMVMANFESKTLKRTFESILFVNSLKVAGSNANPVAGKPETKAETKALAPADETPVNVKSTGTTVQDCFTKRDALNGKKVSVRGKVVKATPGVMGKTWLHIVDQSIGAKDSDLVVTTKQDTTVKPGEIVKVSGKLNKDVDLGSGYFFKVLIEDAKVTVEK